MSHPRSPANVLDCMDYLRHTTGHDKFYRAAVMQIEGNWYAVYNWGAGAADADSDWYHGQTKYEFHAQKGAAVSAVLAKSHEKQMGGYDVRPVRAGQQCPATSGDLPQRVYNDVVRGASGSRPKKPIVMAKQAPPKPKMPVPISITTKDGQLKPALANRTKWRAQE